jgi:ribonuclease P protein component
MELSKFSESEIPKLLKSARRVVKHPGLDFLVAPKAHELARILVITPKRVGNAPERNKVRRRIKALFYEAGLPQGLYDCIAIIKKDGAQLPYEELQKIILDALKKYEQENINIRSC